MKDLNISRLKAAIELLEHKALEQMCEGKTTCTLNEKDVLPQDGAGKKADERAGI